MKNPLKKDHKGKNLILASGKLFDGKLWKEDFKYALKYNSDNKITSTTSSYLEDNNWVESMTHNYDLDANANRILEKIKDIDPDHYKVEYAYDLSEEMENYTHPFKGTTPFDFFIEDFPYVNKILTQTSYKYDTAKSDYHPNQKIVYNYEAPVVFGDKNR